MKKTLIAGLITAAVFNVSGFSLAELGEFALVGRDSVQQQIKNTISTDFEIKRFKKILAKIDAKTATQKRVVARAQLELERSEQRLAESIENCERIKAQMAAVHNNTTTYVSACGTRVASDKERRLASLLASYRSHTRTLPSREKAVESQRAAVAQLSSNYEDLTLQRDTLRQEFESLHARLAATRIHSAGGSRSSDGDLRRASQLRDELEIRIGVEESLIDDLDAVGVDNSQIGTDRTAVVEQVERILNPPEKEAV